MRSPPLAFGRMYGALLMLSRPPVATIELVPATMESNPSMIVFMPDPHILFTVVQPMDFGIPAESAACRAGACPKPAGRTHPISTSSTSAPVIFESSRAALIETEPSSGAVRGARRPWNPPIGVRASPVTTTEESCIDLILVGS